VSPMLLLKHIDQPYAGPGCQLGCCVISGTHSIYIFAKNKYCNCKLVVKKHIFICHRQK
jgi:hypothetical protein